MPQTPPGPRRCRDCDGFPVVAITTGTRHPHGTRPPSASPARTCKGTGTRPPRRPLARSAGDRDHDATPPFRRAWTRPPSPTCCGWPGPPASTAGKSRSAAPAAAPTPSTSPARPSPDRPRDRASPAPLLDRRRAGRPAPGRLRQPPRLPLPLLRLDLRRRHLPPHPRRPHRRPQQRHPGTVRDHPRVFATLTAPSLRPGPQPPRLRPLPLRHPPPGRRPKLGTAARPRDATTTRAPCCGTTTPGTCGATSPSTSAGRSPPVPASPRRELQGRLPGLLRQGRRVPEARRRSTSTPSSASTAPTARHTPPPPGRPSTSSRTPSGPPPPARSRPRPPPANQPARTLRWGTQLDVRPIAAFGDGQELTEAAVASYVAKYATKAAETTGTVDHRIGERGSPRPARTRRHPGAHPPHDRGLHRP